MNLTINVEQYNGIGVANTSLNVDADGISINESTNGGASNTLTVAVTDNTSATISVAQTGFYTYTMTIDNVYEDDKTIVIVLVPEYTNIADPEYLLPVPYFYYFVDTCSFNVTVYNASSFAGEVSFYVNNDLVAEGNKANIDFCQPGDFQIKQRSVYKDILYNPTPSEVTIWDRQFATTETGNTVSGTLLAIEDYLEDDLTTNITILEYRPDFTLSYSSPTNQLDDACCFTKFEEITISSSVTLTREGALPVDHTLVYTVIDPEGTSVITEYTLIESNTDITFSFDKLGTYTVQVELIDNHCGNTFVRTLELETCNFIVIDYEDCNKYTITNRSSSISVEFYVDTIDNQNEVETTTIDPGQSYEINFNTTSLFKVYTTYEKDDEDVEEIYILNNFCNIEDCMAGFILEIVCEDESRCNECPDDVELNRFLLLYNTYFMKINLEYGFNNYYSALSDSKLAELTSIQQIMDKIAAYCKRRGCIITNINSVKTGVVDIVPCTKTIYKTIDKNDSSCKTCG